MKDIKFCPHCGKFLEKVTWGKTTVYRCKDCGDWTISGIKGWC